MICVVWCLFKVEARLLFVIIWLLPCCVVSIVCGLLCVVCCVLFVDRRLLCVGCCVLYVLPCMLCVVW